MSGGTHSPYLGAHVVGQRVVVRRLVPGKAGPTGGPAFVDVLGECVAWDPCVVLTADGERVTIPLELIVSGKPVPPRPSVRLRASVEECESHVASLWSSVTTTTVGAWQVRMSPTVTRKRANSTLAVVAPDLPLDEALSRVRAVAGAGALLHVEADSTLEHDLVRHGCTAAGGEADFMLAGVSRVLRAAGRPRASVELSAAGSRASAEVSSACDAVAEALASVDGDWIGLHDLLVDPTRRRHGLATATIAALLQWGVEQGASTAWLHVETDNAPALALYESLGFVAHHRMRYLSLP